MTPKEIAEVARHWRVCSKTVHRWWAKYGRAVVTDNGKLAKAHLNNIHLQPGTPVHSRAREILGFK